LRGRKPKPTFLKLITGNPGGRPLNVDEPEPSGDLVEPPAWFNDRQRVLWGQALRDAPPGLLRRLDSTVLEIYIVAKSIHENASQKISEFGAVIKAPRTGVPMKSPFVGIANQQAQILAKCISEMGFSPSSRTRVKVESKKKPSALGRLRALKVD
jgi:P27 family predicted phage terminase small subunit